MAVPATMADLSTSEASNSPADSDSITATTRPSDYLRAHAAIIKTHSDSTAEHGATGAVVGTTNTQTLTNKTLTAPVINGVVTTTGLTMPAMAAGAINGTTIPTSKTLLTTDDPGQQIQPVSASVAANALTLGLDTTTLDFRSATLTDGTINTRQVAVAISLVVPDTATLGTVNSTAARLALLAIDNAGTVELAVVNLAGGSNLDETTLISTTAISTGADSNNVIYSTTARTNVPFRVVGFIDITEATAGTWATSPTLVQGAGGNAATAMMSLGYAAASDVTGSRSAGTTYYNTTGKPMRVKVYSAAATAIQFSLTVAGVVTDIAAFNGTANGIISVSDIVGPGESYVLTVTAGTISKWTER